MALALRTVHGSLLTLTQMELLRQQRSLLRHSLQTLGLTRPWKALSRYVGSAGVRHSLEANWACNVCYAQGRPLCWHLVMYRCP